MALKIGKATSTGEVERQRTPISQATVNYMTPSLAGMQTGQALAGGRANQEQLAGQLMSIPDKTLYGKGVDIYKDINSPQYTIEQRKAIGGEQTGAD